MRTINPLLIYQFNRFTSNSESEQVADGCDKNSKVAKAVESYGVCRHALKIQLTKRNS